MSKEFTPAEVAQYTGEKGQYIIIDSAVYDVKGTLLQSYLLPIPPFSYILLFPCDSVQCLLRYFTSFNKFLTPPTEFADEHPGGAKILKRVAGKDASKQFWKYHNDGVLKKYGTKLQVGTVKDAAKL